MSVEFSNAYQEILLDNLMAIIKQNFVFQTQLKLTEEIGKQKEEFQKKYEELAVRYNSIEKEIQNIESYKTKAIQNDSAHQEKQRIQLALNSEMKKNSVLQKEIELKNSEIKELKEYILKLEEIAPVSKLKKINPEKVAEKNIQKEVEPVIEEVTTTNDIFKVVSDGSSF